jgi:hypothetical protein
VDSATVNQPNKGLETPAISSMQLFKRASISVYVSTLLNAEGTISGNRLLPRSTVGADVRPPNNQGFDKAGIQGIHAAVQASEHHDFRFSSVR